MEVSGSWTGSNRVAVRRASEVCKRDGAVTTVSLRAFDCHRLLIASACRDASCWACSARKSSRLRMREGAGAQNAVFAVRGRLGGARGLRTGGRGRYAGVPASAASPARASACAGARPGRAVSEWSARRLVAAGRAAALSRDRGLRGGPHGTLGRHLANYRSSRAAYAMMSARHEGFQPRARRRVH